MSGSDLRCPTCRALSVEQVPPPWERRAELGVLAALWQQFKAATFGPDPFWRTVPAEGPAMDPFLFAWLTAIVQLPANFALNLLNFYNLERTFRMARIYPAAWADWLAQVGPLKYALVSSLVPAAIFPLSFFLMAALIHAGCLLWGAGAKGFHATLRIMGYSQAPMLAGFVPVVGLALAVYVVVQQIFGVARIHGVSGGRATLAVLTVPIVLGCCGGLFGSLAVISAAASLARH